MKKNLLFLLYGILSIALTLFFTACGPTPAYYGTYYSLDKNDYVTIDSTVYVKDSGTYNYTVNGDNIILENNSHLKLFNNYNVMCLADHVISSQNMEFDSRNAYFEATFSIPSESYLTFYKDGTISYIYLPDANAAWKGTYTINNGIISVYGNYVLSNKTIAKYYYLDSFLNLYFMVLCKDGAINQTTEEYKFTYNFSSSLNGYLVSGITGNFNNVIIPSTYKSVPVVGIEHSAFNKCTSLTGITILDCVTWINYSAFKGCSSLTNINVLENNANYKSIDGNLYSKDG
ncbi:MAG: leucine-rich repeat protein, partial [Clostridia bacterium]|nr:leucine-rich repeat protein [Clostridia bacterium]